MTTELHTEMNGHHAFDALLDGFAAAEPAPAPKRPRPKAVTMPASTPAPVAPAPSPVPAAPEPAIISLADDTASLTARLARSLGMPVDTAPTPSMFLAAIEKVHDALGKARADLGAWADELSEKQRALEAREKAVERREAEAAASLALARLAPPTGRPAQRAGWLARLLKRRV